MRTIVQRNIDKRFRISFDKYSSRVILSNFTWYNKNFVFWSELWFSWRAKRCFVSLRSHLVNRSLHSDIGIGLPMLGLQWTEQYCRNGVENLHVARTQRCANAELRSRRLLFKTGFSWKKKKNEIPFVIFDIIAYRFVLPRGFPRFCDFRFS